MRVGGVVSVVGVESEVSGDGVKTGDESSVVAGIEAALGVFSVSDVPDEPPLVALKFRNFGSGGVVCIGIGSTTIGCDPTQISIPVELSIVPNSNGFKVDEDAEFGFDVSPF